LPLVILLAINRYYGPSAPAFTYICCFYRFGPFFVMGIPTQKVRDLAGCVESRLHGFEQSEPLN